MILRELPKWAIRYFFCGVVDDMKKKPCNSPIARFRYDKLLLYINSCWLLLRSRPVGEDMQGTHRELQFLRVRNRSCGTAIR